VVIPREIRRALEEHAREEAPNEACGLLALRDGVAKRYLPGINEQASPFRFKFRPGSPADVYLEDEGYELALFHSHLSSAPRPSRTDIEMSDLWPNRLWVILRVDTGELAAWRIRDGRVEHECLDVLSEP
jgi:[CysO sulfur-carrier protein]-S-L-cysteine hydrolase